MKKKLFKILKISFLLGIVLISGFLFWIKNYWKSFTTEKEITEFVKEIKSTEPLTEKLYDLYEIEYPNSFRYDLNHQVLNAFIGENYVAPPSEQVSLMYSVYLTNNHGRLIFKRISIAWLLEKETTQKECFNWLVENFDFLDRSIGIKKASKYYFDKELDELNDYELATFVVMLKNPARYNPKRRRELVDKEVNKLLSKYHAENDK